MLDTKAMTTRELLATYAAILAEMTRRGTLRTRNAPLGDLMEHVTQKVYGGSLETSGRKSIDLIDAQGRRIQVKARALPSGVNRIFEFSSFEGVDLVVFVMLDSVSYEIVWARELGVDEARTLARFRVPSKDWAIATSKVRRAGTDISDPMRRAYDAV